jgi:hypothetical protein
VINVGVMMCLFMQMVKIETNFKEYEKEKLEKNNKRMSLITTCLIIFKILNINANKSYGQCGGASIA